MQGDLNAISKNTEVNYVNDLKIAKTGINGNKKSHYSKIKIIFDILSFRFHWEYSEIYLMELCNFVRKFQNFCF